MRTTVVKPGWRRCFSFVVLVRRSQRWLSGWTTAALSPEKNGVRLSVWHMNIASILASWLNPWDEQYIRLTANSCSVWWLQKGMTTETYSCYHLITQLLNNTLCSQNKTRKCSEPNDKNQNSVFSTTSLRCNQLFLRLMSQVDVLFRYRRARFQCFL